MEVVLLAVELLVDWRVRLSRKLSYMNKIHPIAYSLLSQQCLLILKFLQFDQYQQCHWLTAFTTLPEVELSYSFNLYSFNPFISSYLAFLLASAANCLSAARLSHVIEPEHLVEVWEGDENKRVEVINCHAPPLQ